MWVFWFCFVFFFSANSVAAFTSGVKATVQRVRHPRLCLKGACADFRGLFLRRILSKRRFVSAKSVVFCTQKSYYILGLNNICFTTVILRVVRSFVRLSCVSCCSSSARFTAGGPRFCGWHDGGTRQKKTLSSFAYIHNEQ